MLKVVEFRPSISTINMGDYIIQEYITQIMNDVLGMHWTTSMPTRSYLSKHNYSVVRESDIKLICGTNLLTSKMLNDIQWCLRPTDMFRLEDILLLGVGWRGYQKEPDLYSKMFLSHILSKRFIHSVRDSYTEENLKRMGITNVVNTSCPTMWGLTEEKCRSIPTKKSQAVVATITDYRQNDELNRNFIECLLKNYRKVSVWIQGSGDYKIIKRYGIEDKINIIPPYLDAFEKELDNEVDYIGTRLHAGIHALNKGKRSIIIAIDNRAKEIAKDTDLPIIEKTCDSLEERIHSEFITKIRLPYDNISTWKSQFKTI